MSAPTLPQATTVAVSALQAGIAWLEGLMLGSLGTSLAILAIALIGLSALLGHVTARDGIKAILGCFILFGAPAIAKGLFDLASQSSQTTAPLAAIVIPSYAPAAPPLPPANPDPYAGAAVPMH